MKTRSDVYTIMQQVFRECEALRDAGQREYAHDEENAFANFDSDIEIGVTRVQSIATFMNKHYRGIRAYIKGHRSQREDVRGRINDLIVYLILLRAAIEDESGLVIDDRCGLTDVNIGVAPQGKRYE